MVAAFVAALPRIKRLIAQHTPHSSAGFQEVDWYQCCELVDRTSAESRFIADQANRIAASLIQLSNSNSSIWFSPKSQVELLRMLNSGSIFADAKMSGMCQQEMTLNRSLTG